MVRRLFFWLLVPAVFGMTACGVTPASGPTRGTETEIATLEAGILALGPEVDPDEAARAARIAYVYTHHLALEYRITDAPLIHNIKVNSGLRERGLCWHWAQDLETRLAEEGFQTLDLHRAIANASNLRIEHSTVILSRAGDDMYAGLVLDPWRQGGILYWAPTREDDHYSWLARAEVFEIKRQRRATRGAGATL